MRAVLPPRKLSADADDFEAESPAPRHFVLRKDTRCLSSETVAGGLFRSRRRASSPTVLGMAILYIPCLILLVAMSGANASFSVLLRRDYGPLLTCGLMAWAAAHLPFALAGFALAPWALSEKTALGLWAASAICFGLLMALGLRMLFGINYSKGSACSSRSRRSRFQCRRNCLRPFRRFCSRRSCCSTLS